MNSRCTSLLALLIFVLASLAFAGPADVAHHSLIKLYPKSKAEQKELWASHLDFLPEGPSPENLVAALPADLKYLQDKNVAYEVIQMDMEEFYVRRARNEGSLDLMGGYRTMDECYQYMHNLHVAYPTITTDTFSIGNTLEGRHILCMKISDNPSVDENEIELFYNSLIHAREPAAMESNLYFMNHLCANYAGNPDIAALVNNREFYFVPIINVDGYEYNRTTNPGGGGMWRKNRRSNGDGSVGVDLNRNFGFNWGFDNSGSSPTPNTETYRGTSGFSEPETQVLRSFINSRDFTVVMNYHTYSNLVLHSWGTASYQGGYTPDESTFQVMRDSMAYYIQQVNGAVYTVGPPWLILYSVNGDANDWAYGAQDEHGKIFAFTTEIGSDADGFWPSPSRIVPLCAENLPSNLFVARYAVNLLPPAQRADYVSNTQSEQGGNGDGVIQGNESVALSVRLKNIGSGDLTGLSGALSSSDPYATIITPNANWNNLSADSLANSLTNFVVSVSNSVPPNYRIPCTLHVTASSGLDTVFTVGLVVGTPNFTDNVESGTNGWTPNVLWHISTRRSNSPTHAWYSGNEASGQYNDNMDESLVTPQFIVANNTSLTFYHWYNLENTFDYGIVEINDGTGWTALNLTYTGSNGNWQRVSVPIHSVVPVGSLAQIRFRMTSDGGVTAEGWHIDDIQIGAPALFTIGNQTLAPTVGTTDSLFTYSILYTSETNLAPAQAKIFIDNVEHSLTTSDFTYSDGSLFSFSTNLPIGMHNYYFYFQTGTSIVRLPDAGTLIGPFVGMPFLCYDFETDQSWTVGLAGDNATSGIWNRADPEGTFQGPTLVQPEDDHTPNPGVNCYVTDSRAGTGPTQWDVDGGKTTLLSPVWDLSSYDNVALSLWTWYSNNLGANPGQDAFTVDVSQNGGTNWINLLNDLNSWQWRNNTYQLENYITLTNQVRIRIVANDASPGSLVEAAADDICLFGSTAEPGTPAGLTIISSGNDIVLRWEAAQNATSYRIERATSSDGPFTPIGTSATLEYIDVNAVSSSGLQYYQVRATN